MRRSSSPVPAVEAKEKRMVGWVGWLGWFAASGFFCEGDGMGGGSVTCHTRQAGHGFWSRGRRWMH